MTVDDLEEGLKKRDHRFVLRLIVLLLAGLAAGLWIAGKITGPSVGGCAARGFGTVAEEAPEN